MEFRCFSKLFLKLTFLLLLLCLNSCTVIGQNSEPFHWNSLITTYGLPLIQPPAFKSHPLTEKDAIRKGYKILSNSTQCQGEFLGQRYFLQNDMSIILLYDINGYIAGIQIAVPRNLIKPTDMDRFKKNEMFLEDNISGKDVYVLTAYLVDPAIICTTGRSETQFSNEPSGTGLWLRIKGSDPIKSTIAIPLSENELNQQLIWKKGGCIPTMGRHYWYNVTENMDCDYYLPVFLLYNRDRLVNFGWAILHDFSFSPALEHPPKSILPIFMRTNPACYDQPYNSNGLNGITSMHIYMNKDYKKHVC